MIKAKYGIKFLFLLFSCVCVFPLCACAYDNPVEYHVQWSSVDNSALSLTFASGDYSDISNGFGTLTFEQKTYDIMFVWHPNLQGFIVFEGNEETFDYEKHPLSLFNGKFKNYNKKALTITLEVDMDKIFKGKIKTIFLKGVRIDN